MKLIKKIIINQYERILKILGIKIYYKKSLDAKTKKTRYDVKIFNLSFSILKKKRAYKKNNLLKFDNEKQLFALIYAKALRSIFSKIDKAETLILGSSTARCSYIEDENSINLAIDAQDLYYSYELYKKFAPQIPNLKNLVLYYDIFSNGNDLDISPTHYYVSAYYKVFFDIPYKNKLIAIQNNILAFENKLYSIVREYINKHLDSVAKDIMPMNHGGLQEKEEMLDWIKAEIKLSKKGNMHKYLELLLNDAKNLNIYIVLAPRNPLVLSDIPPVSEIFKSLFELVERYQNKNIKIVDCFGCFKESDFVDLLHLNLEGAKKITGIIHQNLQ